MNSYKAFLADMGEAPEGLWLDRIDNNLGYAPGNCRWVTPKESARNKRQRGPVQDSLRQQAIRAGLPYQRVIQRVRAGWVLQKALTVPIQKRGAMTAHARKELNVYSSEA
jgi:hypothetical protein